MNERNKQEQNAAVYFRAATREQISPSDSQYMREWTEICQAYCDKVGAELLFVNMSDFGCEMPNGELRHIDADELAVLLTTEQPFVSENTSDATEENEPSGPELKMF